MPTTNHLELPTDLARWGWAMSQMKLGPRKHPGGWCQFIFHRHRGLAGGDEYLEPDDPMLRVKIRRSTCEEALFETLSEMHRISATLTPGDDYAERFAGFGVSYTPVIWTTGYPPGLTDDLDRVDAQTTENA